MSPAHTRGGFFQLGYVTRDLDRAVELYRSRYGVKEFLRVDTSRPDGGPAPQVALAYRNGVMIEMVEPAVGAEGIYEDALRPDGGITLHHVACLVDDLASLASLARRFETDGIAVPVRFENRLGISAFFADTRPDIGHFSEYVFADEEGLALFDRVPQVVVA